MEFVAKQMFASKMGEVKNLTGGGDGEKKDGEEATPETDPELIKQREEAEAARKEKHRKMEEQREGMRQGIRDKVSRSSNLDQFFLYFWACYEVLINLEIIRKYLRLWSTKTKNIHGANSTLWLFNR